MYRIYMKSKEIVAKKGEDNYIPQAEEIIDTIAFKKGKGAEIIGSISIRSRQYAHDYDIYQRVSFASLSALIKEYQTIVKRILKRGNLYIMDTKIGEVDEWVVLPEFLEYEDYNGRKVEAKLKKLREEHIIGEDEYKEAIQVYSRIGKSPSREEFSVLKKFLRFHILRWTPKEILDNRKSFRGRTFTLEEALQSRGVFKMDTIAVMNDNTLQEFNILYDYRIRGKRLPAHKPIDIGRTLKEAYITELAKGNYFKALKRAFSYYNYVFQTKPSERKEASVVLERVFVILNSDLGILSKVIGDIETLQLLVETGESYPKNVLKVELDHMINRLSNVYSASSYLKAEPSILDSVHSLYSSYGKKELPKKLEEVYTRLTTILNKETKRAMDASG